MIVDRIRRFFSDEDGQSIVEYSLLLTLIAASSVLFLTYLGLSISRMFGMSEFTVEGYYHWAYEKYKTRE